MLATSFEETETPTAFCARRGRGRAYLALINYDFSLGGGALIVLHYTT